MLIRYKLICPVCGREAETATSTELVLQRSGYTFDPETGMVFLDYLENVKLKKTCEVIFIHSNNLKCRYIPNPTDDGYTIVRHLVAPDLIAPVETENENKDEIEKLE